MDIELPLALLGGLTPQRFMRRHWQKSPLLVRQAWPGVRPPVDRAALLALAQRDDVESRLVELGGAGPQDWSLARGPFKRRRFPPMTRPRWTLLVQGLDLHIPQAREMLSQFRFVPDARMDDLMLSLASDEGGVGPHVDSYDVFLLQVKGQRRWRIGPPADGRCVPGLPLRILQDFQPNQEWLLEAGDMLYLPPNWGHEGVAVGADCMTCSIGFRAPSREGLAADVLQRLAESVAEASEEATGPLYQDARANACAAPGRIPAALQAFAQQAVRRQLQSDSALNQALGESMTEPKAQVWFEAGSDWHPSQGVLLDARTRMMYDDECVYINGESLRAKGRDAGLARRLADDRQLEPRDSKRLSSSAAERIGMWVADGWAHSLEERRVQSD